MKTPYIKKGAYIDVEGSPQVKVWVDKEGKPAGKLVCNAFTIDLMGGGNADKSVTESAPVVSAVVGGDEPAPTQEFTC